MTDKELIEEWLKNNEITKLELNAISTNTTAPEYNATSWKAARDASKKKKGITK